MSLKELSLQYPHQNRSYRELIACGLSADTISLTSEKSRDFLFPGAIGPQELRNQLLQGDKNI
jgi:hypothetical protein